MMKNFVALLLLAIWLTLGAWYYTCKVKDLCIPSTPLTSISSDKEEQKWDISSKKLKNAYQHIFKVEEDIQFQASQESLISGSVFNTSLDSIVHFLKVHPTIQLTITAPYTETEDNPTSYESLGLARAIGIQEKLEKEGIPSSQILVAAKLDNSLFEASAKRDLIDFKFSEPYNDLNDSEVKATYRAIAYLEQQSQFYENGEYIIFSEEPNLSIAQVDYYLNRNKEHLLQVNVPFTREEESIIESQDIGLVRALDLKQQLSSVGIKKENMLIDSRQALDVFDPSGLSLPGKIRYNFVFPELKDSAAVKEQALEKALAAMLTQETDEAVALEVKSENTNASTPMQFKSGSHNLEVTEGVLEYVIELKLHLQDNPNKELVIIGHTDNKGADDFNFELGRIRAFAARRLLVNHKVSPRKIRVVSEGEFSPIASNEETDGRRLNRRVEIDIQ